MTRPLSFSDHRTPSGSTAPRAPDSKPIISVVVPVFDERGTLEQLHAELTEQLKICARDYEIIFIDDGSSDGSTEVLMHLAAVDPQVHTHRFRANQGKAEALNFGFRHARGDIVVTMDADLQDQPSQLPNLLAALETFDMVTGWKQDRQDPMSKTLPSRFFNWVTRKVSGVDVHDFNCGFKAYRAEVVRELDLYGEMHRFVPLIAASRGFAVGEVVVEHAPRVWGKSKYGFSRLFKGAYDLLTLVLLTRFENRPMHFFGSIGLGFGTVGFLILSYMAYLRLVRDEVIGNRPLLLLGVVMLLAGLQLATAGLMGELLVRRTRDRSVRDRSSPAASESQQGE